MALVLSKNDNYITSSSKHEGEYVNAGAFGIIRRIKTPVLKDQKEEEEHNTNIHGNGKELQHVVRKRIKGSDIYSIYGGLTYSSVRECTTLRNFAHHPHIIQHQGIFVHPNGTIDILLPEYEMDLMEWIMQTHNFQTRVDKIPYLLRCLSSALVTMHQTGYLHRDIKLHNILFNPSTDEVCLIDFGSSRCMSLSHRDSMAVDEDKNTPPEEYCVFPLTTEQTTFPYRAPETYNSHYNAKSDIYSLGCTMIYVIVRSFPYKDEWIEYTKKYGNGSNERNARATMFSHYPTSHDWLIYLNRYKDFLDSLVFNTLKRMIHPNPRKRPSAQEIFQLFSHDPIPTCVPTSIRPTNPTGVLEGLARNAFLRFIEPYAKTFFTPHSVYVGIRLFQRIYPQWERTYADIHMRPKNKEEEHTISTKKSRKNRREQNIQAKYDDFSRKLFDMSTIWYLMFVCCSIAEHFISTDMRVRTAYIIDVMQEDTEMMNQQKMTEELFTHVESKVFILADCCVWWGKLDVEPFTQHLIHSNVFIEQMWKKVVYVLMFKV